MARPGKSTEAKLRQKRKVGLFAYPKLNRGSGPNRWAVFPW